MYKVQRPKLPKGSFDPKRTIRLTNSTQRGDPPVPTPQRPNAANHSTSTYSSSQKGQKQVHVLQNPQIQFIKNCSCVIPKMANLITKRNTSQRPRKPFHIHLHTNRPSFTYLVVSVPVALPPLFPTTLYPRIKQTPRRQMAGFTKQVSAEARSRTVHRSSNTSNEKKRRDWTDTQTLPNRKGRWQVQNPH